MDTYNAVLNVRTFPSELLKRAKIQAAIDGISLKEFVIEAIKVHVEASELVQKNTLDLPTKEKQRIKRILQRA